MTKYDLAIRDGWFSRILRALKLVTVQEDGSTTHQAGSDFIGDEPGIRTYSAINSMAAMARFPWVRACVEAVSSDITKVPIRIINGRGKEAKTIEDHPFFDLLDRPSSRMPGILFKRQLIVDMLLTGDAFVLIAGNREPEALLRLHPERVKIIPNNDGQIKEYEYSGSASTVRYGYEQILHFRTPSWQSNPSMLYGSGAIESLHNDLTTDLAASKLAAESAQTGLPTGIISPSEPSDIWTRPQIQQLREGFEKQLRQKSGTVILGAGVEYKQLSHSLRDLEYQETRKMAKEAVMAALGVVPVRVGVESANYASSRQQMRLYWEQLQARSMLMDSEWNRLLRMFPNSEGLRTVSDFSEVDALQESRTERVNRVQQWWLMGVSLQEAATLEGFENLNENEIEAEPPENEDNDIEEVARWLVYKNDNPITARAVGDVDPTNFPMDGDDETVSLENSKWDVFDVEFAEMIKLKYPSIWRKGGNVKGNEQFRKLRPIALQGGSVDNETEEEAVRLREAWGARHLKDFRIAGVVAQMKWLVVGSRGERYMKDLIIDEMDKIDAEKGAKWLSGQTHKVDINTEEGRAIVWRSFIDKVHTPHERRIAISMRRYLRSQAARIAKRLKAELGTKSITKSIDPIVLDRILDEAFEKQQILGIFRPLYRNALNDAYEQAAKSIDMSLLFEPAQLEREAIAAIQKMETSVLATTKTKIGTLVNQMIMQGVTMPEMQRQILQSSTFDSNRALAIARTETTRVANYAANEAFKVAEKSGIQVQKMWLSARDDVVRDAHRVLDGETVPTDSKFNYNGDMADAPGLFQKGSLDINCRCTIIGKVGT